jgi:hypothetical protein
VADDYYVVVRRSGSLPTWEWEIQRRSTPLGVVLNGSGFVSQAGAKLAGENALRDLLAEIKKNTPT